MRPRRSRKYRNDSFKENEEQESEDNEPKSPVLPWKKDTTAVAPASPLSMVIIIFSAKIHFFFREMLLNNSIYNFHLKSKFLDSFRYLFGKVRKFRQ